MQFHPLDSPVIINDNAIGAEANHSRRGSIRFGGPSNHPPLWMGPQKAGSHPLDGAVAERVRHPTVQKTLVWVENSRRFA